MHYFSHQSKNKKSPLQLSSLPRHYYPMTSSPKVLSVSTLDRIPCSCEEKKKTVTLANDIEITTKATYNFASMK